MFLSILQVLTAIVLIGAVLLQVQGGGISPVFGGGGEMYRSKRNVEKLLIIITAISATLLAVFSIALIILR